MMKNKKYLSKWLHNISGRVNTLDELLKTEDKDLDYQTPYQMVSLWFLDVLVYGFVATLIWNAWFGWQGWNNMTLIIANGLAVWMLRELIKIIKEAIRE